jgi:hypothetical protein
MNKKTDWFRDAQWGVFVHYLTGAGTSAEEWNARVDGFDTEGIAAQLHSVGAKYLFFTIGQSSGHYCAPNETYDRIAGVFPSKCARRDLIADLYDALEPRGIKLLVYMPSEGPHPMPERERFGWEWGYDGPLCRDKDENGNPLKRTGKRLAEFQLKWEAVIEEWSVRWGRKVAGWWVDSCYFADAMYRHPDRPNFQSFAGALKAGNPDAIAAFNPGERIPVISWTEYEDFTAGEQSYGLPLGLWVPEGYSPVRRWVDGAQFHVLNFLGQIWGDFTPRFPDELVAGYTHYINRHEGVVTWEVPVTEKGRIPDAFIGQLAGINRI